MDDARSCRSYYTMLANQNQICSARMLRTLGDVEVTAWVAVKGGQGGVHIDAVLRKEISFSC